MFVNHVYMVVQNVSSKILEILVCGMCCRVGEVLFLFLHQSKTMTVKIWPAVLLTYCRRLSIINRKNPRWKNETNTWNYSNW